MSYPARAEGLGKYDHEAVDPENCINIQVYATQQRYYVFLPYHQTHLVYFYQIELVMNRDI